MVTVIVGTNRKGSRSEKLSMEISELLSRYEEPHHVVKLADINNWGLKPEMYNQDGQSDEIMLIQDSYIVPANKFVFILPEYNGSYPGVFKLFIDALSVRKYTESFKHKSVALVGLADGRGGNSRGLDQIANSSNYLGMVMFPERCMFSEIDNHLISGRLKESSRNLLMKFLDDFIVF